MANVGTSLKNWSTTEASNQPDGSDSATIAGDLRAIQAGVRHLRSNDTIASASTCDLGSKDAEYLSISGTTTITALGTVSAGIVKRVVFEGALTLTHGAALLLPGSANIVTAAGDAAEFVSLGGGNWRCTQYQLASGGPVVLANDSVTFAKIQNIATSRILGRSTALSGDIEELTIGSGLTLSGGQLSASMVGFKNLLINGAMAIDQRNSGAAQSFTAGAALAYSVDRWYGYCTGANVTGQRVAGTTPNQFNYRFTGAASVTKIGFSQRIEAANSQHLAGTTATLSVDLANSLLTTVTWTAWYANTADTFGTLASPTRTQIATGTFTVNSTLTRYSANISIPAAATTGIEIEFSVGSQTSGTWTIGRAQLEAENSAPSFDYRPVGQELALCQRYYYKYTGSLGIIGYTGDPWNGVVQLKVPMRITPTLDAGATFSVGSGSAGTVAIKSATGVVNSENSVLIHNSANNWTVGAYVSLNNAGFSAEL